MTLVETVTICHSLKAVNEVVPLFGPGSAPFTTLDQVARGATLVGDAVILVIPALGCVEYQYRPLARGMLGPATRTARFLPRPGICDCCGRVMPCAHSNRA